MKVTNTGNQTWNASGVNPVHLGIHFSPNGGGAGMAVFSTDQRFSLPNDISPGGSVTIPVTVTAPTTTGPHDSRGRDGQRTVVLVPPMARHPRDG